VTLSVNAIWQIWPWSVYRKQTNPFFILLIFFRKFMLETVHRRRLQSRGYCPGSGHFSEKRKWSSEVDVCSTF